MTKKPRNPNASVGGTGFTSKGDVTYDHATGSGHRVMRKGKTARDRAKRGGKR